MDNNVIFNNEGDVYVENQLIGNLKERYYSEKIIDGRRYGGGKNKINDPFTYGFVKGSKYMGLVNDVFEFKNIINRDVMYALFNNLYQSGKMYDYSKK